MSDYRVWGRWYCRGCEMRQLFITYDRDSIDADMAECYYCGFVYGKRIDMTQEDPNKRVRANIPKRIIRRGRKEYLEEQERLSNTHGMLVKDLVTKPMIKELLRREGEE